MINIISLHTHDAYIYPHPYITLLATYATDDRNRTTTTTTPTFLANNLIHHYIMYMSSKVKQHCNNKPAYNDISWP